MEKIDHLFIVGAGFSSHAGIPLASQFTEELLNKKNKSRTGPSFHIIDFLNRFVQDVFFAIEETRPDDWPNLEDVFTCVDLAANSGHYLGEKYSPSYLRTVRRALIVRTIRMLYQTHERGEKANDPEWQMLMEFFSRISAARTAFLSMNWDTVIEEGLASQQEIEFCDYGCNARPIARLHDKTLKIVKSRDRSILILKPHGSANWLYCDVCRQLFWLPPTELDTVARALFRPRDWEIVQDVIGSGKDSKTSEYACPNCGARALGTRFATFSYRKALDFPMHARSWLRAEEVLREAKSWTFIGYSMPAADYEFKHLLKHVQLSRPDEVRMTLITGGGGAQATVSNFMRFLGPEIDTFERGLDNAALAHLSRIGALRAPYRKKSPR